MLIPHYPASQNSLLFSFINTYIFNQHLNHMFISSVSRPRSSAPVQPSHFVFWTRFLRVFSCLLLVSLCTHSIWQPPTYPPLCWWYSGHCIPTSFQVLLRFQKQAVAQAVQGVTFSICHPYHRMLFLYSCPAVSMAPQLMGYHKDMSQQSEIREGIERKTSSGRSSVWHCCQRFPTTAWSISSISSISSTLYTLTKGKRYCTSHHRDTKKKKPPHSYNFK